MSAGALTDELRHIRRTITPHGEVQFLCGLTAAYDDALARASLPPQHVADAPSTACPACLAQRRQKMALDAT